MADNTSAAGNNSSYWARKFTFPDEASPIPLAYLNIPGSSDGNAAAEQNKEKSEALFPFKDGTSPGTRLPPPLDNDGNPIDLQTVDITTITPDMFAQNFHSAHQLELLKRLDVNGQLALGTGDERLDVLLASDGKTVLVLQHISKNDLMQLGLADQILIVNYLTRVTVPDAVKEKLAFSWQVTVGDTVENNRLSTNSRIDAAIAEIGESGSTNTDLYIEQLQTIKALVDKSALFALGTIQTQIDSIKERFVRMLAFEKAASSTTNHFISLDGNASIKSGLQVFLAQEKRLLDVSRQRLALATVGNTLDLPSITAVLQLTYNLQKEADVALMTEELNQQNALVKDYAEMQRIVNNVLKKFPPGSDANTEARNAAGIDPGNGNVTEEFFPNFFGNNVLSDKEIQAVLMFTVGRITPHPLESLRGITRPSDTLCTVKSFSVGTVGTVLELELGMRNQSEWNIFATQVADGVTLINQQSQILTNDISTFNQEANRHFDLANTALKRMMDMIAAIART